jgi:hypothetical protein
VRVTTAQEQEKWEEVVFGDNGTEVCQVEADQRPERTNNTSLHATNVNVQVMNCKEQPLTSRMSM